jgi:hypothetical protein
MADLRPDFDIFGWSVTRLRVAQGPGPPKLIARLRKSGEVSGVTFVVTENCIKCKNTDHARVCSVDCFKLKPVTA